MFEGIKRFVSFSGRELVTNTAGHRRGAVELFRLHPLPVTKPSTSISLVTSHVAALFSGF